MARNDVPMLGMRRDGGLHRRRFLQSAAQFGAGPFGASSFGLLPRTALAESKDMAMGSVASGRDPAAMGIFRKRASA